MTKAEAGVKAVATGSSGKGEQMAGLVGHWKLQGDCRDASGGGKHGINHGVDLRTGTFDGAGAHLTVPAGALRLGRGDFSLSVWIHTEKNLDDAVGDVLSMYDPSRRRGFTLSVYSSAGGYQTRGEDRHVFFGIDNGRLSDWEDCGRPSRTSRYVSNSMVVFKGSLYAATSDGEDEEDWGHVFRYEGGQTWADCGRVGNRRTTGVGPLVVHQGDLYAVTGTIDWTRVEKEPYEPGRVYRYGGGKEWEDIGAPSGNHTLNCAASYRGRLYVGGGVPTYGVYVHEGGTRWAVSREWSRRGHQALFPHAMTRYRGRLYVGFPGVHTFDGERWEFAGVPCKPEETLQTHSLAVFRGELIAGTWPTGRATVYRGDQVWEDMGRVGEDGTEINSLVVYNGKLYGGSIPRAEVCRYDGDERWTSLRRFYSPPGWDPGSPSQVGGRPTREQVNAWSRVTSMTICRGSLFASIGSCTSSVLDTPADVRGSVHRLEAGKGVTCDEELEPGWRHLAAAREGGRLRLYIDGRLVATSSDFDPADYDLSTEAPLQIGFGESDFFSGKMADVRIYDRALSEREVGELAGEVVR